ncbi:hypothetical protein ACLOAV_008338 [Pseudogymnoascus australis]
MATTQDYTLNQYYIQPPPSPPMEEFAKLALPSLSSLLRIADNGPSLQQEQARRE